MASKLYGNFLLKALNKEVDFDTDTIKVALLSSSYTPNQDTHDYFNDVSSFEVSGTGYTAGGNTLTGFTSGLSSSTGYVTFSDPSWTSSTITARGCLIYNASKSNKAVAVFDFGENVVSVSGTLTIDLPAAGASALIRVA